MSGMQKIPGLVAILGSKRIQRDHIRRLLVQQHEPDRAVFKALVTDESVPLHLRLQVQRLFETEVPRQSAPTGVTNRCVLTGRAHGVARFCRLSRIMIRQLAHVGMLPGVSKATW